MFNEFVVEHGRWKLTWEYIGEGHSGDYDEEDTNDEPLLRASLTFDGEEVPDSSYCTLAGIGTAKDKLEQSAKDLLLKLPDSVEAFSSSVMERWTWTDY